MTNTLHRFSEHYAFEPPPDPRPVENDFIVFAMATRDVGPVVAPPVGQGVQRRVRAIDPALRRVADVDGVVREGEAGFVIEFGRPGVGARFREIQEMTKALAALGVEFEKKNPVTSLMTDTATGLVREDILNEKILSAIVEVKVGLEQVPEILRTVRRVSRGLETVVAVGVSTRCDADGSERLGAVLAAEGYPAYRGKTNLGLGRMTVEAGR